MLGAKIIQVNHLKVYVRGEKSQLILFYSFKQGGLKFWCNKIPRLFGDIQVRLHKLSKQRCSATWTHQKQFIICIINYNYKTAGDVMHKQILWYFVNHYRRASPYNVIQLL